ncbi:hypothetical protein FIBSPDRAFT_119806 [Athelia psychrophila]|uniref:Uncharacterized protein n=1 Tax=Athelia psychrophila TaxID=1759441 RepID=A0A166CQI0_9AGAM|nr:hypothetical protein FIBSPDRAFT_119806 [Fibularhizoctonia sp. CBS 109695]
MQDPRKPPRARATGWALHRRDEEEERSPVQAWLFFAGFVLFPVWWLASVMGTPETRRVGGSDVEKAVVVDDPQVERGGCFLAGPLRLCVRRMLISFLLFFLLQMRKRGVFDVALWQSSRCSRTSRSSSSSPSLRPGDPASIYVHTRLALH